MEKRRFAVGDRLVSVRDLEASNVATVISEEDERGFVVVQFADGVPRTLPVRSLQRPDKFRLVPDTSWRTEYSQSANLGEYLTRMGEAEPGIFTKEKEHEKSNR
jgi:hypothetical protein